MFSRHAHYKSHALSLLPLSIIIVLVLLALTLTAQSAAAASPHVDRMVLNGEINPASLHFLTKAVSNSSSSLLARSLPTGQAWH
jgi:membrane-bound ClpP family serine protease